MNARRVLNGGVENLSPHRTIKDPGDTRGLPGVHRHRPIPHRAEPLPGTKVLNCPIRFEVALVRPHLEESPLRYTRTCRVLGILALVVAVTFGLGLWLSVVGRYVFGDCALTAMAGTLAKLFPLGICVVLVLTALAQLLSRWREMFSAVAVLVIFGSGLLLLVTGISYALITLLSEWLRGVFA